MALDRTWYNSLVDDDGSGLTGSVWDKADVNSLMTAVDTELAPDGCSVSAIARQTASNVNQWNAVEFDTVHWQSPANMFAAPANLITIRKAGYYLVNGVATWPQGSAVRGLAVYVNGSNAAGLGGQQMLRAAQAATYNVISVAAIVKVNVNDYIQLAAFQSEGGSILIGGIHPTATNHLQVMLMRR